MFGWEATVKHTLHAAESARYLGTDEGIINVELMKKLYHVIANNLSKTRAAPGANKPKRNRVQPKQLRIGDKRPHLSSLST